MIFKTFILISLIVLIIYSLPLFHQNSLPNNVINRNIFGLSTNDTEYSNKNFLNERKAKISKETFHMLKTGRGHISKKKYKKRKGKFQVSVENISSFPQYNSICKTEKINVLVNYNNCISQEITSE